MPALLCAVVFVLLIPVTASLLPETETLSSSSAARVPKATAAPSPESTKRRRRELLLLEQDVWARRVAQDWPQFRPLWRHRVAQATSAAGLGSLLAYFEAHCPPASLGKAPGWRL